MMNKRPAAARDISLAALVSIERDKAFSGLTLQGAGTALDPRDQRLVYRIVYGVTARRLTLDWILNKFCKKDVKSLKPKIRNILRMGCYQLLYLDRVPDFAAVNESVDMARSIAGKGVAGFVNGVLRSVLRNKETLFDDVVENSPEGISILYSHPQWLVNMWVKEYGLEFTQNLCKANNEIAPLSIRVNSTNMSRAEYEELVKGQGLKTQHTLHPQGLVFSGDVAFSALPGFKDGLFLAQGEASMLPGLCLELSPGQRVLDMCSAPGGKTTQIAEAVGPTGLVLACDLYPSRLKLVEENAKRLGLQNIQTKAADASNLSEVLAEKFDRILLDAPCSGFGVIRKKPEIKWVRSYKDIQDLASLQKKLLNEACELLNPGGLLVYSTCTIARAENQQVVDSVLTERGDMARVSCGLPELERDKDIFTLPHIHNMDGFYIAKLKKVE